MHAVVVILQLLLLLPALPLAVMSHRTSRAHRSRHTGYLAVSSILGLLAVVLALVSLSLLFAGDEGLDPVVSFLPPLFTLLACGLVVRRGLAAGARRTRSVQRPRRA
jgi:hypothetical protein